MVNKKLVEQLEKQGYRFSDSGAVKICEWNKKSLLDGEGCYKQRFYGIKSHKCCQMSPWVVCQNKCLHCWRAIDLDMNELVNNKKLGEVNSLIDTCILSQRKLLTGFKGNSKVNMQKWKEAQEPENFAISLIGEPTLYPKLGELIKELRKRGKSTFLVTNGLLPDVLEKLEKDKALPTQLYISLNYPNEEIFHKLTQNKGKNVWGKFLESLKVMKKLKDKTRRVLRMTLVRELNLGFEKEYAELIKKASPDFVECKGFVSVGFARERLGYDRMPTLEEIREFAKNLAKELKDESYKILDEHEFSKIVLLGKDKNKMKIKKGEI